VRSVACLIFRISFYCYTYPMKAVRCAEGIPNKPQRSVILEIALPPHLYAGTLLPMTGELECAKLSSASHARSAQYKVLTPKTP
jgi:hypothetical protein